MSELKPCINLLCGSHKVKTSAFGVPSVVCCECLAEAPKDQWQAPRPVEDKIKAQGIKEALAALDENVKINGLQPFSARAFVEEYAKQLQGSQHG